ncbi:MAG: ATP-binding protein [Polynucleobacter sp.]|uniref:AAA family ATPase n=1 Tax=Polynucleobacter sp. TaxID=2029855 RepID=UPI00271F59E1|nr:ATP-binding protein [Polynucleobacter sp.]MDO8713713.1 ATP-binding protein [Polynucleobacter sp.]
MLIEFSVENWRSIKSRQTFSFLKTSGDELLSSNCYKHPAHKDYLLKVASLHGPNAGGKSNLLGALGVVEAMVLLSANKQRGDEVPVEPFALDADSSNQPTEFELIFISDGVKYQYGFSASKQRILEEWLFAYPKKLPQKWLARHWNPEANSYVYQSCPSLKARAEQKNLWQNTTRQDALFLSTAVQLNCLQLQGVFDWFNKTLRTHTVGRWTNDATAKMCKDDEQNNSVLDFLKAADLGIHGLKVDSERFSSEHIPDDMPADLKLKILENFKDKEVYDVKTLHITSDGRTLAFDLNEESDGTQKMFSLASHWLLALKHGYVVVVDELNDNLHPKLVRFLVQLFQNNRTNPNGAQLLFSTHDTSLLDQTIMRRDQIWFCEKDDVQATQLKQLKQYKVIKGRENIEAYYHAGYYAAVPVVGDLKINP